MRSLTTIPYLIRGAIVALVAVFAALGVVAFLAVLLLGLNPSSDSASAATGGPEMQLNVKGGNCDHPVRPTKCSFSAGTSFILSVDALVIPAGGYDAMSTAIDLGF